MGQARLDLFIFIETLTSDYQTGTFLSFTTLEATADLKWALKLLSFICSSTLDP